MWALVVVAIDEVVELGLLPEEVAGGGFGGLKLEREMHAFVAAVLHRSRITTGGRTSLVRADTGMTQAYFGKTIVAMVD